MKRIQHKLRKVKKHAIKVWRVWQLIVLVVLSTILVPVFVSQGPSREFYAWLIPISVAIYLIILVIGNHVKHKLVRDYLETTGTRLFLGLCAVSAAFLSFGFGFQVWGRVLLAAGGVLYAAFLQQVGFLRVIGL